MTHHILDPQVLTKYLEIIEDDLEDTAPEYEPVFTSVYQYCGNSLASFTNIGDKRECTQIILETEYVALTDNNYVPLTQVQISLCAKIGHTYYCEYAHLLKKRTEHTCMSAIYYDQESKLKQISVKL